MYLVIYNFSDSYANFCAEKEKEGKEKCLLQRQPEGGVKGQGKGIDVGTWYD